MAGTARGAVPAGCGRGQTQTQRTRPTKARSEWTVAGDGGMPAGRSVRSRNTYVIAEEYVLILFPRQGRNFFAIGERARVPFRKAGALNTKEPGRHENALVGAANNKGGVIYIFSFSPNNSVQATARSVGSLRTEFVVWLKQ